MSLKMEIGTVEMVPVTWIMQNITSFIDTGTDDVADMYYKTRDSSFTELVNAIVITGFRIPVVIDKNYSNDGGLTFGNGHHRFLAAIFLFLDEIPVYWSDDDYMASDVSAPENSELSLGSGDFSGIELMLDIF